MPDTHALAERPSQGQLAVYDAIVIGAGISGMYMLYRLRGTGHDRAGLRGRHERRRHLVLEPLSRRAL
jgi:flavin-dependent dehydrogenase